MTPSSVLGQHQPVAEVDVVGAACCPGCNGEVVEFLWVVKNQWYCSQTCGRLANINSGVDSAVAQTSAMLVG